MCESVHRDGEAYLVIKLQHLWGEFCRELVVRSAIGGCETRSGRTLPPVPGVRRVRDISNIAPRLSSGPQSHWEDPVFAIRQAKRLQVANHNEIDLGLGSVSTNLANIKCIRNFIVHPNKNTRGEYYRMTRSIGFAELPPHQLLHQFLYGGATVFDDWVANLMTAAWNAVD